MPFNIVLFGMLYSLLANLRKGVLGGMPTCLAAKVTELCAISTRHVPATRFSRPYSLLSVLRTVGLLTQNFRGFGGIATV